MSNEIRNINVRLIGFKTEQFATIEESVLKINDEYDKSTITTNLRIHIEDDTIIKITSRFEFLESPESTTFFLVIEISTLFEIEKKDFESLKNESGDVILPNQLGVHLISIAIGATRGALFAKTEGTIFSKFPLPLMNLTEHIKNDIVVKKPD